MVFLRTCLFLCSLLSFCSAQSSNAPDNKGTEFIVVFMRNLVETPSEEPQELYITAAGAIEVQVTITTPKFFTPVINLIDTVQAGQVKKFDIDVALRLDWVSIYRQVVRIQATNDIVVYGINRDKFSTDGFLAFPIDVIGYTYYTVSYTALHENTQFAVAAAHDSTSVYIQFTDIGSIPIRVEYNGNRFTQGDNFTITLQKYEVFQCVSYDKADLSGTFIRATKPVAVFSGNVRTAIGESQSRDHLVVQVPPVVSWGKRYLTVPFPSRTTGDVFRVIGSESNTNINVLGIDGLNAFETAKPGHYVDVSVPSTNYTLIMANKPVLVVQLGKSQLSADEPADPTMLLLVATSQFSADYTFTTPKLPGGSYENFLMCVVEKSLKDGLLFDNKYFSELSPVWRDIPGTSYVGTQVPIQEGAHVLRHQSSVASFGGYLFGKAPHESYSLQIGQRLASINQPCTPTIQSMGDGIDNDCDGRIDEELCMGDNRGVDTDRDGAADEDCVRSFEISTLQGAPDSGGTDFMLFFMENQVERPLFLPLELHITPSRASSVTVNIQTPGWFEPFYTIDFTVSFGEVYKVDIPYTLRETGTIMTSKVIRVTSSADIVMFGVNKEIFSADAFLVFPVDVLGNEYYAVTIVPSFLPRQIGIAGIFDGTSLSVTFPQDNNIEVIFSETKYLGGSTLNLVINRYNSLQLQSLGDLTGTHIKATHRIAVFSGNVRSNVGSGHTRDHLVAMIPPVESWGMKFCTVPIPGRTIGDYFKILASVNDTRVVIHPNLADERIHAGQHFTLLIPSHVYAYIEATKPILVTQVSQSQRTMDEIGDPTMIVLPAIEQWGNSYSFSTTQNAVSDNYKNYLMVVAPSNQLSGILYDGQFVSTFFTTWVPINGANYSGTFFEITPGAHTIQHHMPSVTISVILYGNSDRESYGFPVGMRLAQINQPCIRTFSVAGDGIDNDCDGRIDEETCALPSGGTDDDKDGSFNEDCAIYIPPVTVPNVTTISLPTTTAASVPGGVGATGPVGPAGPPGLVGATGLQGPPGAVGVAGLQGPMGPMGPIGPQGSPGLVGAAGLPGSAGQIGATGLTGSKGDIGPVGASGSMGPQGPVGTTGSQGSSGQTGATGSTGASGPMGPTGGTGLKGDTGDPGVAGPPGESGLARQGVKGEPGVQGVSGVVGTVGATGATGVKGEMGASGVDGPSGFNGSIGATGKVGATGMTGLKGDIGSTGVKGDGGTVGAQGTTGATGPVGATGSTGPKGDSGVTGDKGAQGATGLQGAAGLKGEKGESISGPTGDPGQNGVKGEQGSPGMAGAKGDTGQTGAQGVTGETGATGTTGPRGQDGTNGSPGQKGAQGETGPVGPAFVDVDECLTNNGNCMEVCENTIGGFVCKCSTPGYSLAPDGKSCVDTLECQTNNGGCTDTCSNTDGAYTCSCATGYKLAQNNLTCVDFDECLEGTTSGCALNEYCINSVGGYLCLPMDLSLLPATAAPAASAVRGVEEEDFFKNLEVNPRYFFYWLIIVTICMVVIICIVFWGCYKYMTVSKKVNQLIKYGSESIMDDQSRNSHDIHI